MSSSIITTDTAAVYSTINEKEIGTYNSHVEIGIILNSSVYYY